MEIKNFMSQLNDRIVLALGFFDCVHVGHQSLISVGKKMAKDNCCKLAIFTFKNNPMELFDKERKLVYDFDQRCKLFEQFGVDICLWADFNNEFKNTTSKDFLNILTKHNLCGVVCGFDYTFGKDGLGNVEDMTSFCKTVELPIVVVPQVSFDDKKISSSLINKLILDGNVAEANKFLGVDYHYSGVVLDGYKIGRTISFPTINLQVFNDKILPKDGVYVGWTKIDGQKFKAIINVGTRPTFEDESKKIEAHLLNFDGDLYGKNVTIYFSRYLRDCKKFDSVQDLSKQLTIDKMEALNDC